MAAMRAQPFYCPYCGEEDFVPHEEPGTYVCNSCGRNYTVKLLGIHAEDRA
jgi:transcription initiation factor TFIIIB Brf1 subunit/transcription initiation factor TFIIB